MLIYRSNLQPVQKPHDSSQAVKKGRECCSGESVVLRKKAFGSGITERCSSMCDIICRCGGHMTDDMQHCWQGAVGWDRGWGRIGLGAADIGLLRSLLWNAASNDAVTDGSLVSALLFMLPTRTSDAREGLNEPHLVCFCYT